MVVLEGGAVSYERGTPVVSPSTVDKTAGSGILLDRPSHFALVFFFFSIHLKQQA